MENKKVKKVADHFKKRNKPSKFEDFISGLFSDDNEKGKPDEDSLGSKITKGVRKRRLGSLPMPKKGK